MEIDRRSSMQKNFLLRSELLICFCLIAVYLGGASPAPTSSEDLQQKIEQRIKEFGAESVGIYYEKPDGSIFTHNADAIYHAASTMKVPVMMEVFREVETGELSLDQKMKIMNEFTSIVDGSKFSVDPKEDSDAELYNWIGKEKPLRELLERMITRSSNLATDLIIGLVTPEKVRALMTKIGAKDMYVLRGVEDIKAYQAGKINTTSAHSLAICMKELMDPKLFSESSRNEMFEILTHQEFRKGIPKGIHSDEHHLIIANKTGDLTEINHDAAIIRDSKGATSILVILTRGVKDDAKGKELIAVLAGDIWDQ
ncbi:MAG: serine hydrolase [Acidobacteria bacterium]|nr:MAG: serine hydrolase [Acidobacteriota bacterium]